jgi:hypothetical protein
VNTPSKALPAPEPTSRKSGRTPGGSTLGRDASREARRLAAAILEVLAGVRTPAQAATAVGLSLPRYYQVEGRALQGLVAACEAKPRGRGAAKDKELSTLRRQQQRLQREVARQQALVRLAQRAVGLPPPAPPPASVKANKRRRRPTARALRVAQHLRQQSDAGDAPACPAAAQSVP